MRMIKLYRYQAGLHCDGGLFPPYDKRCSEWSSNKKEQVELYNSATVENFDISDSDLYEFIYWNKYEAKTPKDIEFFWCILFEIEVPLLDWEIAVRTDNYEPLSYLVDYNFKTIAERGISFENKSMRRKTFNRIIYSNAVTEGDGVYRPEDAKYGKL